MKKLLKNFIVLVWCTLLYIPLSGAGFKISSPDYALPICVEITLEDGNIRGGILMPGKTLVLDAKLSAIVGIKFSQGTCTFEIYQDTFRFPPKYPIVELRLLGVGHSYDQGQYDIIAEGWGRMQATRVY